MRSLVVVLVLAGCGRVGFDSVARGDGGGTLSLTYPSARVFAVVNATAISVEPTVSEPASFSIAPALPAGVTIDAASGAIAGVPTASSEAVYTVTATAGGDTATATLDLTALPGYIVDTTADTPDTDAGADTTCADAAGSARCAQRS